MKIVYCLDSIRYVGGIQVVTCVKANALAAIPGNEVWVIVTDNKKGFMRVPLSPAVRLIDLDINYYEDDWRGRLYVLKGIIVKRRRHRKALRKILGEIKPDVVISVGQSEKYFLPSIAGKARTIREFHFNSRYRSIMTKGAPWYDRMQARIADFVDFQFGVRRYDRIVLLTEADRVENWSDVKGAITMPNPLTLENVSQSALDRKEIISVGRLGAEKNYESLVRACAKVFAKHPDWHLTIYGEGNMRDWLQRLATKLDISEKLSLPGTTTDVTEAYAGGSIFALTSHFEGFGLVLVEAMSAGVPVVAYNLKYGPSEIITDGRDGFLVPHYDEDALARALCRLIENPELRKRMGRAALEKAKTFSVEVITQRWMSLFKELANEA